MGDNEKSRRRSKRRKIENSVRLATLVVLVALCGTGYVAYAKYFSESARWGIAIASQVYFTANYAAESEEFFENAVTTTYDGKSLEYTFEVRNYENNLLFNASNVEIPYTVSFWVDKAPENASYKVVRNETEYAIPVGQTSALKIEEQSIEGGSALADKYIIKIDVSGSDTHEPEPIYVEVQTDDDSMINKTLRGKMALKSGGAVNTIQSAGFVVPGTASDSEPTFDEINKLSVLTYEVRIVGEASGGVSEELKLSWNPTILEIDLYDEAYLAWQEKSGKNAPLEETVDGVKWYYITMEVMPYSAESVNFLRGEKYSEVIENSESDKMTQLETCINIEFQTTSEESE